MSVNNQPIYSPGVARNILLLHAEGYTLEEICRDYDGTPERVETIDCWCRSIPKFADELLLARSTFAKVHAERLLFVHYNVRDPQMARIVSQNVQWLASKYAPKVYGDAVAITIEHKVDLVQAIEDARQRVRITNEPLTLDHDELLE